MGDQLKRVSTFLIILYLQMLARKKHHLLQKLKIVAWYQVSYQLL